MARIVQLVEVGHAMRDGEGEVGRQLRKREARALTDKWVVDDGGSFGLGPLALVRP